VIRQALPHNSDKRKRKKKKEKETSHRKDMILLLTELIELDHENEQCYHSAGKRY